MKKTIKLAVIAALALGTTSVFATNGINQIATGAKARGMGGVGIATSFNGENTYSNPSMITRTKKAYVNVGLNVFKADVSFESPAGKIDSTYGTTVIPSVSGVYAINESFYIGGAVYGSGGMGVDYTDDKGSKDELAIAVIGIPMAYKVSGFSVGITPLMKYGSLSVPGIFSGQAAQQSSSTTGLGVEVGADYELELDKEMSLTFAGVYKSAVELDFGKDVIRTNRNSDSTLATPSVIGLGVNFDFGANTVAFDFKRLGYGSAKGFEDFDWVDQNVFALGYQYAAEAWEVRAGINYGDSPLGSDGTTPRGLQTSLNLFPAVTTTHYTLGGTWNIDESNSLDLGVVFATGEQKETFGTAPFDYDMTATNNQTSAAVGYTYNF